MTRVKSMFIRTLTKPAYLLQSAEPLRTIQVIVESAGAIISKLMLMKIPTIQRTPGDFPGHMIAEAVLFAPRFFLSFLVVFPCLLKRFDFNAKG